MSTNPMSETFKIFIQKDEAGNEVRAGDLRNGFYRAALTSSDGDLRDDILKFVAALMSKSESIREILFNNEATMFSDGTTVKIIAVEIKVENKN